MDKEQMDIELNAEIAAVQRELIFFRDECLPAFIGHPIEEYMPENVSEDLRDLIVARAGNLSAWRGAAVRLAEALPLGRRAPAAPLLDRDDFREFLFQDATSSFASRDGRIVWQVGLHMSQEMALDFISRCLERQDEHACCGTFLARLPEIKSWLMGLPVDEPLLWNALCSVAPAVADADPAFVKLALDAETWRTLVLASRGLSDVQREKRLRCIDGHFGYILNNALLHVLGALASNHFLLIQDYLDHPNLRGRYTHLMPHYLFAVLFEKVATLCRLAADKTGL